MSVERRYSKRYPISGDVYIRYRKQRAFPAKAVNCSLYGMFLKTHSLTLLSGALVELDLYLNGHHWQIVGVVNHSQRDGLGVMFCNPQRAFYESVLAAAANSTKGLGMYDANLLDESCIGESTP